jgi:hypothetical protein
VGGGVAEGGCGAGMECTGWERRSQCRCCQASREGAGYCMRKQGTAEGSKILQYPCITLHKVLTSTISWMSSFFRLASSSDCEGGKGATLGGSWWQLARSGRALGAGCVGCARQGLSLTRFQAFGRHRVYSDGTDNAVVISGHSPQPQYASRNASRNAPCLVPHARCQLTAVWPAGCCGFNSPCARGPMVP